jgi:hypothetical protein
MRRPLSTTDDSGEDDAPLLNSSLSLPSGDRVLSAQYLTVDCAPYKCGVLLKENKSILVRIFPCWYKKHKQRFVILVGSYMYKFSSEYGEKPKGEWCVMCVAGLP